MFYKQSAANYIFATTSKNDDIMKYKKWRHGT